MNKSNFILSAALLMAVFSFFASGCGRQGGSLDITSVVANPVITPAGGYVATSANVTMTCATPGAKIYYTTDESEGYRSYASKSTQRGHNGQFYQDRGGRDAHVLKSRRYIYVAGYPYPYMHYARCIYQIYQRWDRTECCFATLFVSIDHKHYYNH